MAENAGLQTLLRLLDAPDASADAKQQAAQALAAICTVAPEASIAALGGLKLRPRRCSAPLDKQAQSMAPSVLAAEAQAMAALANKGAKFSAGASGAGSESLAKAATLKTLLAAASAASGETVAVGAIGQLFKELLAEGAGQQQQQLLTVPELSQALTSLEQHKPSLLAAIEMLTTAARTPAGRQEVAEHALAKLCGLACSGDADVAAHSMKALANVSLNSSRRTGLEQRFARSVLMALCAGPRVTQRRACSEPPACLGNLIPLRRILLAISPQKSLTRCVIR